MPMRLRGSLEAVFPIVGALLVVAITAAITTIVILVFNRVTATDDTEAVPIVMSHRDEGTDRLVVIRADGFPLERLRIQMSVDGHFAFNALASSSTTALPANTLVPMGGAPLIAGGDAIYFCADAPARDVRILVQDTFSGKIVTTAEFSDLAACL